MVRARRDRIQAAAKDGVMRNRGAHQWEDSCSTDGVALGEEIRNDAISDAGADSKISVADLLTKYRKWGINVKNRTFQNILMNCR